MANTFSGKIEEKASSDSNGSTLYKFKIAGKTYSVYANRLSPDSLELVNALKAGDEVEGEYIQKAGQNGRTYNNLTSIVKVDRPERFDAPKPVQRGADPHKDRGVALRYAVDAWCAGKIEPGEMFTYADQFLAYITGATDEDGQGEF